MNEQTARRVHELLMQASGAIDNSVAAVQDAGVIGDELIEFKHAAGRVLGEMWFGLLEPLYNEHPALIPPELKHVRGRPDGSN
jgi:hypothetical protein